MWYRLHCKSSHGAQVHCRPYATLWEGPQGAPADDLLATCQSALAPDCSSDRCRQHCSRGGCPDTPANGGWYVWKHCLEHYVEHTRDEGRTCCTRELPLQADFLPRPVRPAGARSVRSHRPSDPTVRPVPPDCCYYHTLEEGRNCRTREGSLQPDLLPVELVVEELVPHA